MGQEHSGLRCRHGLGYDLDVFLHKVAQNSPKYHISLKIMSNCLDLVRLLMLKLKK